MLNKNSFLLEIMTSYQGMIILYTLLTSNRLLKIFEELVDGSKMLFFCSTKKRVDFVTEKLRLEGWPALSLHGERAQSEREWVISEFKNGNAPFLIATDVAARGLDIQDIALVINYDMPVDLETYVHRIGRTGRAGKNGRSISFITPENSQLTPKLVKLLVDAKQIVPEAMQKLAAAVQEKKRTANIAKKNIAKKKQE